ncbi:MAG: flotillin family protein [Oscillospiraceae bacterium]|jgi:flotillin|nr:flotillin family protein [Oscillospiraceae bacterium]
MPILSGFTGSSALVFVLIIVFVFFGAMLAILSRYRKCPSDKILVIYGKVGQGADGSARSAKCVHGGAAFIWPVIQSYQYLDLTPISINVDLRNALSRQNIRIDVPSRFTVGISTEPGIIQNAAERLMGLKLNEVQELAQDILFGQLRLVIATMDIEEINTNRDKFLEAVAINVETELKKIGLRLINVNVTDISDESGYLEALGKEAAAQAINDAKRSVAEKDRDGTIGEANAVRDQRVAVSLADSEAVKGENTAKIEIANSDSLRREREAEATRRATAAEKVQSAKALEEAYAAEKTAELARAAREQATMQADMIVRAEIEKRTIEIAAEADAEQIRRRARGEADAIYAKMEAQARGVEEMLSKQAAGLKKIVDAADGNLDGAVRMMITDKLEDLVKLQVEAVSGLKIDKVTVWDGAGGGADGKSATAGFLSGLLKSLPPLNDVYKMAGLELPDLLSVEPKPPVAAAEAEMPAPAEPKA